MTLMLPSFTPEPRHDETIELDLASLLTTEAQADRDAEQLAAVAQWIKETH